MTINEPVDYHMSGGSKKDEGKVLSTIVPCIAQKPELQKLRRSCRLTLSYMAFVSVLPGSSSVRYWSMA